MADPYAAFSSPAAADPYAAFASPTDAAPAPAAPAAPSGIGANAKAGLVEGSTGLAQGVLDAANPAHIALALAAKVPGAAEAAMRLFGHTPTKGELAALHAQAAQIKMLDPTPDAASLATRATGYDPSKTTATTLPEKITRGVAQAAPGLVLPVGEGYSLKGLIQQVPSVLGSGVGGAVAQDAAPDELKPVAAQVGAALGGIAPHVTVAAGRVARAATPESLKTTAGQIAAGVSQDAAEQQAGHVLANAATDPQAAAAALADNGELVPGSQPTTFQQTGDVGLGNLEREQATKSPEAFNQRRSEQNVARTEAVGGIQQGADPNDVAKTLKAQFEDIDAQTQAHVDDLTRQAREQVAATGGTGNPEDLGQALRAATQEAEAAGSARIGKLYDLVDPDGTATANVAQTAAAAKEIRGGLSKMARPMEGEEAAIFDAASEMSSLSPLRDLIDLRSRVSDALRAERGPQGSPQALRRLTMLRGAIEDNLTTTIAHQVAHDDAAVARGILDPTDAIGAKVKIWTDEFYAGRRVGDGSRQAGTVAHPSVGASDASGAGGAALQERGRLLDSEGNPGLPGAVGAAESLDPAQVAAKVGARVEGESPHGPTLQGLQGRWSETIEALSALKSGDAVGALNHPDVGPIDVVWGNGSYGLSHILAAPGREALIRDLPDIIARSKIVPGGKSRVFLEDPQNRAVVALDYQGEPKRWLLTAYERGKGRPGVGRIDSAAEADPAVAAREGSPDRPTADNVAQTTPTVTPETTANLKAASDAYREHKATFAQGPVGRALAEKGAKGAFTLPDGRVPQQFFHPGPTGFSDIQALIKASGEKVIPTLADYAAMSLRRAAELPDGTLDPAKFSRWRQAHTDALRALPADVQAKFSDASRATDAVRQAQAARTAALKDAQTGAIGKVMGLTEREDVTKTVGAILNGRTAVADMKALAKATAGNPDARAGLRQAVADHITRKLFGNTEAGTTGVVQLRADQFQTFMKNATPALNLIFKPDEVALMKAVAADLQRANRSVNTKLPGQSNTAQDLAALKKSPLAKHGKTMLTTLAGAAGLAAHGATGGIAGVFGLLVAEHFHAAGVDRIDQLVTEAMLHPAVARRLLAKVPEGPKQGAVLRALGQGIVRSLAVSVAPKANQPAV